MRRIASLVLLVALVSSKAFAEDLPAAPGQDPKDSDKHVAGMSIVGNDEAPKSLVIVPWKSSDLGDTLDVSKMMDDGRQPVDRDVFRRALDYYEIRTSNTP
ncbi:MAG: hypothetical protein QMC74_17250 [Myxococcota bacterium]|jgi:hypothetical protein